jgi:hypothetical protein
MVKRSIGVAEARRDHVSLPDHLRALHPLAADHHVNRHFAVGIQRKIERLELVVSGELFVEAGCRIETSDDPCGCVMPVDEFLIVERELRSDLGRLR